MLSIGDVQLLVAVVFSRFLTTPSPHSTPLPYFSFHISRKPEPQINRMRKESHLVCGFSFVVLSEDPDRCSNKYVKP
jgi:hypothetical protein